MELKNLHVGIISLGWLGEKLANHLSNKEALVWGTVSSKEKAKRISDNSKIEALVWHSDEVFSEKLKIKLSNTDLLILNLPPSVFNRITYAEGLRKFTPFLSKNCKVIFTSSTSVYPDHLTDAIESYVFKENEINKIGEAEADLSKKLKGNLTILRLAGLIGEDRNPVYYLAKKEQNGSPEKPINLIHRNDIIKVVEKIIQLDFFGEIFNICHPDHPTRKEYYTKKAEQFNLPKLQFTKQILDESFKVVNCDKLMKKLDIKKFTKL